MSIIKKRKPQVDISADLNMTVASVVPHDPALKEGELMKIPQCTL